MSDRILFDGAQVELGRIPLESVAESAVAAPSRGAGRSRRRPRWEVEYDDEIIAFPTAESAHQWLSEKIAEEKAEAKAEARKPPAIRKPVERHAKPVVYYEGIDVSRWKYYNKPISTAVEDGARLKQLEYWIRARMDDDDDEEAMAAVM